MAVDSLLAGDSNGPGFLGDGRDEARNKSVTFKDDDSGGAKSGGLALKLAAGVVGGAAVGLMAICTPFILPAFRRICLPYVPATDAQVSNVFHLLKGRRRGGRLVDLGSGDGRIVVEAAKQGFIAHGIELNPWLVLYSKFTALRLGLHRKATYSRQDLWKADLSGYDNVVIFGVEEMMQQLEDKFCKELKDGTWVVACRFPMLTWQPSNTIQAGVDSVWLYEMKKIKLRS